MCFFFFGNQKPGMWTTLFEFVFGNEELHGMAWYDEAIIISGIRGGVYSRSMLKLNCVEHGKRDLGIDVDVRVFGIILVTYWFIRWVEIVCWIPNEMTNENDSLLNEMVHHHHHHHRIYHEVLEKVFSKYLEPWCESTKRKQLSTADLSPPKRLELKCIRKGIIYDTTSYTPIYIYYEGIYKWW